jgi:hypothetical protein
MSSTCSLASAASVSVSSEPVCEPWDSARSMNGAVDILPTTGPASLCSPTSENCAAPTSGQLTLFAEDFPARTSAKPESASASKESAADCGGKCCGWCRSCDPVGWSLRTSVQSDIEAMTGSRPTWKRLVTPAGRSWWQLSTSELRRNASERGLWQTPTTRDYKGQSGLGNRQRRGRNGRLHVANLCDQLVDAGRPDLVRSPTFREWMMGLPIGFTASRRSATPSSRRSPKSSGEQL